MANYQRYTEQVDPDQAKKWPAMFPDTFKFDDNHDENGPIGGTSKCTMTPPAEKEGRTDETDEEDDETDEEHDETDEEDETENGEMVIDCDCASPKEFKFLNKGMVFYTFESPE